MALIKCKECNKEISDTSKTCPHCGIEIKSNKIKRKKINTIDILIIIALVIFSIAMLIYNNYGILPFIYLFTYISCYWLIFLYYKNSKPLFKILSGVFLLVSIIMYLIKCTFVYNEYFGKFLILKPSLTIIFEVIYLFIPLIVLYLIVLGGKNNGTN